MKLASDAMMKLMAYADGELEAGERAEVEALLAKDAEAKRFVAQLGSLGAVVKAVQKPLPEIDVVAAVMAKVKDEQATEKSKVVSLDARRAQRTKIGLAIAAVMAVAAAIAFYSRPQEQPLAQLPKGPPIATTRGGTTPSPDVPEPGVVVEAIDSPGQTVKVIYGPDRTNEMQTSVIIWVDEERK